MHQKPVQPLEYLRVRLYPYSCFFSVISSGLKSSLCTKCNKPIAHLVLDLVLGEQHCFLPWLPWLSYFSVTVSQSILTSLITIGIKRVYFSSLSWKLYDLSYSYFFSLFLLNSQWLLSVKIKPPCRWSNWGISRYLTPVVTNNHFWLFSLFSFFSCRLIHPPYRCCQ